MTPLSDGAVARLRGAVRGAGSDDAPPPNLAGTRYVLGERIGRGGMGTVYVAHDAALGREVALKVLDAALDEGAAARLRREARILARLEHPGIVPVHDVGTLADGRTFYTMKRVRGPRLDEHVRTLGAASLAERLRLFERICEAVAFAHAHGVVHRDLKPENVMVGAFGEVLVLDWGIAKVRAESDVVEAGLGARDSGIGSPLPSSSSSSSSEAGPTLPGMILGTPGYMAPEQARGESAAADERSDVYALGGVLRFLLGTPAPRPLQSVCRRAMAVEPEGRYASVGELSADVACYVAGERVAAHRESPLERAGRFVARYRTPIALVAAYLFMRLLLLVLGRS